MQVSVTAIIPCYRCADTVRRAVESVARQTVLPIEVILVDDGSGDNTLDTLYALQAQYSANWIKVIALDHNQGVSVARNTAWDVASGDYIAFLDADDVWHPEKIDLQYDWMCKRPDVLATGHKYVLLDPSAPVPERSIERDFSIYQIERNRLLLSNPFVTPSVMIRRAIPYRFHPGKRYTEDYYLWLQIVLDGKLMVGLNVPLAFVYKRLGESGASRNLLKMRAGDISNYWLLWRSGKLGVFQMSWFIMYSMLKFLLLLVVGARSHYAIKRWIERD